MKRKVWLAIVSVLLTTVLLGGNAFAYSNPNSMSYSFMGHGGTVNVYCSPSSGAAYTTYSGSSPTISITCRYYYLSTDGNTYVMRTGGSYQAEYVEAVTGIPSHEIDTSLYATNTSVIASSSDSTTVFIRADY